jgi:hypothetical protein
LTVTDHASRFLLMCEAQEATRERPVIAAFERRRMRPPSRHPLRQRRPVRLAQRPVQPVQARRPIAWLVDKLLPEKGTCFLAGPSGIGKTFLAMELAASIATGRGEFFGRKLSERKRAVVWIATEGEAALIWRLKAAL